MKENKLLSVREIQNEDIEGIARYWLESDPDFLGSMGVDLNKLPTKEELTNMLTEQINTSIDKKLSYALIWLVDNTPVGHANVNKIEFSKQAYMHLHLWQSELRQRGIGTELVMLLPFRTAGNPTGHLTCRHLLVCLCRPGTLPRCFPYIYRGV